MCVVVKLKKIQRCRLAKVPAASQKSSTGLYWTGRLGYSLQRRPLPPRQRTTSAWFRFRPAHVQTNALNYSFRTRRPGCRSCTRGAQTRPLAQSSWHRESRGEQKAEARRNPILWWHQLKCSDPLEWWGIDHLSLPNSQNERKRSSKS